MSDTMRYAVDVPNPHSDDGTMIAVDYFYTRDEAIGFAQARFGADGEGRINLVSELPPEDGEDS